ncbi:14685_t:CDS:2 [Cetraspora pellucida]|uniref:14685_t:CDS:1 n=1 Tax=Cetraspora pellucida TaxID=1433469 RepID=A0A9N9IRG3_9GLOM|nr:14685_t:CDS:2 [Cetraspora pellucida]
MSISILSFGLSDIPSLLIIFIISYVTQFYYRYFTRINPLPGPIPLPIIGNIHQKSGYSLGDWYKLLHKQYGDMFEVNYAGQRTIVLCRPDLIENMNTTSTKTKYPIRFNNTEGLVEYGISAVGVGHNNNPKSWKFHRQFFTQSMLTPSFSHQAVEWTNELWKEMESYWNKLDESDELDITKWMHRFTNEIIFKIATGVKNNAVAAYHHIVVVPESIKSLNENEQEKLKYSENFVQSIQTYMGGIGYFFVFNKFIRNNFPFIRGKVKSLLKNKDDLFDKISKIIKERRTEIENTPLDQPLRHDLLTSHITANTPRDINVIKHSDDVDISRPMNDKEIFGNIFESMIAGTDTSANMFCFIVYYLGHHPEVKKRLRQEFDEVFGNNLTKPITYKDLEELQYCDAVIKEVNRHNPVAFMIGRVSTESDNVGGYEWPEGTVFQMYFGSIMKSKNYWTDPEKFDPDRFYKVEESDKYLLEKKKIQNTYSMFGGGIRMCPGRKLAIIELKCLMTLIYRNYDIDLVDINAPLKRDSGFINSCRELMVRIKPRKF